MPSLPVPWWWGLLGIPVTFSSPSGIFFYTMVTCKERPLPAPSAFPTHGAETPIWWQARPVSHVLAQFRPTKAGQRGVVGSQAFRGSASCLGDLLLPGLTER